PGAINERRDTRGKRFTDHSRPVTGTEAVPIDGRPARDIGHAGAHARLDGEEDGAENPAERLAEVVNAGRIQIAGAVAGYGRPALDHPDELHQVCHGLPLRVTVRDNRLWRGRELALPHPNGVVAILVDAATARGERHRLGPRLVDRECAEWAEAVAGDVDG